ncbi:tigger transposable element-derived protein 1-like isoform X2 [Macrobrachium nipponense]|uniref:tigger transposable element-derived protein 1-like isoform X2 n=1 Tax=Macrobrachium nipponense TaxID=159736 RepID=UPI0030C854DF
MDSNPVTMSFSVNGRNFGKCYEVSHRSLQGKALFPHILTKNCTFKIPPRRPPSPKASGKEPKRQKVTTLRKKVARQDYEVPSGHTTPKASGKKPKCQKKVMTLQEKVALLEMLKEGKSYAAVGRHYGINESTVRYIKKKEVGIRKAMSISFCSSAKRVSTVRSKGIVRMELALAMWITDCHKKNIPLNSNNICTKAQELYQQFSTVTEGGDIQEADFLGFDDSAEKEEEEAEPLSAPKDFMASNGWFNRFQKRFHLKCSWHGEMASTDREAAMKYPETFKSIIREKGYRPEQVFNVDDSSLFWKKMPSRTYLMKDEASASGFKAQKDRVTLIMCGNAAGFMLKPGLIYRAANPRALKNKNRNFLPVFWMHNTKAWFNKVLMSNWFIQSFIPQVKEYLKDLCMEFKVLLIMDDAGGHPVDLCYEGVQLEFLPANTSPLQPMNQGVIRAFKALYTQNSLEHLVREMDTDTEFTLKECWRKFTIATCLTIIGQSLKDMKKETFNACWKKLWPECVHNYEGFSPEEVQHSAIDKAVQSARILGGEGFSDMTEDEVGSLIDAHSDPLTNQDLEELTRSASEEENTAGSGEEEECLSQIMGPASSKASDKALKRPRKVMTLQEKVELLEMLKDGKSCAAVGRHYGINESTVRHIKKKEVGIRKAVSISFRDSAKKVSTVRSKSIVRMESALAMWITDCRKKIIPLNSNIIRTKAQKLYQQFSTVTEGGDLQEADFLGFDDSAEKEEEEAEPLSAPKGFMASNGWFNRFLKRFHIKRSWHREMTSTDREAAAKYPETFKNIIRDKGYRPEQVFSVDHTSLFWKKMPSRTYLMKDEASASGFKAQKDRVTLIMCGNVAGFMLKPGLIYRAATQGPQE